MATVAVLPPALRAKIDAVARHVRLLRAVRGLSTLLLVLALGGGLALLADAALDLPWTVRAGLLAAWSGLGLALAAFGLVLPLCRRLDAEAIAAAVEEKYPDLGERLTSAVELAGDTAGYHGSPAFIAMLISETEVRASRLDFLGAVPARFVWALAAVAAAAALLVAAPAAVAPDRYGELVNRFFFPAQTRPAFSAPFAFDVEPGDTAAAVGRPLTLSAHVRPLRDGAALPATATLVTDDGRGNVRRDRMIADAADAFSFKLDKVPGSFAYHVEADGVFSDTHQVRGIVPVELAARSPLIRVTPPEYVQPNEPEIIEGLNDFRAVQYGQAVFEFRFTRPATAAALHWSPKPADRKNAEPQVINLELSEDRLSARARVPVVADGTYRLVMEAEEGIRTEPDERHVVVQIDLPPKVVKATLPEDSRTVLPYEKVPVYAELADDFGVQTAEVEYRVNNGPPAFDRITLWGEGGREAQAQHLFALGGKVKDGDSVAYRLKVQDNRRVPEAGLTPNVTYYPGDGWRHLKISRQALPLREQEIASQRDSINRQLEAIKEDIRKEKRGIYRLQQESRPQPALEAEQVNDLDALKKDNRSTEDALQQLADEAADAGLKPIAERARDVADKEMRNSGENLAKVKAEKTPDARTQRFEKSDQELANALQKLDDLKKLNDLLAQQQLDQMKLELAAERQKDLAQRAEELAAKDPVRDPSAKNEAEQLRREQQEVANELKRLTEQSEAIKNALDQARADQAKQLAEKAKELAEAQRLLAESEKQTEKKQADEKFGELAKKQQELAERAAKLAQETKPAAQSAKANPLRPDDARKAAEALKENNVAQALQSQDQSARELDRLANELNRAIDLAKDPREAARQLARLEENLQKRMAEEAKKPNDKAPLSERLEPLQREQEAIRQAAERLSLPPQNQPAQQDRTQAEQNARMAAEALKKADTNAAKARMEQTKQALNRLAEKLPTLEQRQQQAAREVAELRRQQDEVARLAEQATKDAKGRDELAKKLTDAARKQADAAERLGKMDAPNQEARQERAQAALNRALSDLMDARPQDVKTSQQEARRELERLQQALNGQKPADDPARVAARMKGDAEKSGAESPRQAARELARQQRELARATQQGQAEAAGKPGEAGKEALKKAMEQIAQRQQQLNDQASKLPPPNGAQKAMEQAREAMSHAQEAARKNDAERAQQKQRDAAAALDRVAQQAPEKVATPRPDQQPAQAEGLPNKQQTEQAKHLAQQQRDLRQAVLRAMGEPAPSDPKGQNALAEIAREQQDIARQAGELAKDVGKEQGEKSQPAQSAQQAAQSARQAANRSQAGAMQQAQQSGRQAAQQLRNLAQQMAQAPRPDNADPQAADPVQQARDLAKRQESLNKRMGEMADNPAAQRAQQEAQQQSLQQQAGQLAQDLSKLAQQMNRTPPAQQAANQAAMAGRQAQGSMQQAQNQERQGNPGQAHQSQEQAAQALDRAAQQMGQAGRQMANAGQRSQQPGQQGQPSQQAQAGQALQDAQGQQAQAQQQLGQGQRQGAQQSMQQAAQSLAQAAQSLAQAQQPGQPGRPSQRDGPQHEFGAAGGLPDLSALSPELKKYAGKRWGDLPGELRTKIIQDMQTKFGEDYARNIKLYFEQLAEMKK